VLSVAGVRAGERLGQHYLRDALQSSSGDGSVIIVIATDAPLSDRNLERLATRSFLGIARTGSPITNGSGDYAVAFSTHPAVRRTAARRAAQSGFEELPNEAVSPLFQAVAEATEEAVINALFVAESMAGDRGRIEALPTEEIVRVYRNLER
jgi:D-aminopeptidase